VKGAADTRLRQKAAKTSAHLLCGEDGYGIVRNSTPRTGIGKGACYVNGFANQVNGAHHLHGFPAWQLRPFRLLTKATRRTLTRSERLVHVRTVKIPFLFRTVVIVAGMIVVMATRRASISVAMRQTGTRTALAEFHDPLQRMDG